MKEEKSTTKKKKKLKIFLSCLSIVFCAVFGLIITGIIIDNSHDPNREPSYVKSPYLSAICKSRVQNAQYVPDISKIEGDDVHQTDLVTTASVNSKSANSNIKGYLYEPDAWSEGPIDTSITVEGFNDLIDTFGHIYHPADSNYSIFKVKDSIYDVLSKVATFNRWVNFEGGGGTGDYYIGYNEQSQHITVIQEWRLGAGKYYDVETNTFRDLDEGAFSYSYNDYWKKYLFAMFIKTDYYFNEDGVEVVECEVLEVKKGNLGKFITTYEYMKNVKDTSFTKYIIYGYADVEDEEMYSAAYCGLDITTNNEFGVARQFIQMDYKDNNDVSLFTASNRTATAFNKESDVNAISFFRKIDHEVIMYKSDNFLGNPPEKYIFEDYNYNTLSDFLSDSVQHGYWSLGSTKNYDPNYKVRNNDKINILYRALYLITEDKYIRTTINSYVDINKDFYSYPLENAIYYNNKLQKISIHLNNALTQLARNTFMSEDDINKVLLQSPAYLDINDKDYNFEYENFLNNFLCKITKNIFENSYLTLNAEELHKTCMDTRIIIKPNDLTGANYYINLNSFNSSVNMHGNTINYSASASVNKTILLKIGGEYQLCLVAKGTGNGFSILQEGETVTYNNADFSLHATGSFNLENINVSIADDYKIGIALMFKNNGNSSICSEVQYLMVDSFSGLNFSGGTINGFEIEYLVSLVESNLQLVVKTKDIQDPTLTVDEALTYNQGATINTLLSSVSSSDNDKIANMTIIKGENEIYDYNTLLESGVYTITVFDSTGNATSRTVTIAIE